MARKTLHRMGIGLLGLTALTTSPLASADGDDIGLVIGPSGLPVPTAVVPGYVYAADLQYLNNSSMTTPLYPDLTFYQATSTNPDELGFYGPGLPTPEGLYPLTGAVVHQLYLNYP